MLTVPSSRVRQAGHMISDAIYQALTGIAGDFSGRIAYVLRNPQTPAQRSTLQIADTDGEQPKTVLSSRDPILSPTWTPDAKKIAYVSFETKRPAIYIQDLATGQREVLASFKGLNGDIIIWNPILERAFEISSMGIRVDKKALNEQLKIAGAEDRKNLQFHKMLLNDEIPLSVGGGIGQSRICMYFLQKAHIGEVQSSIWPEEMINECQKNSIFLM